MARNKYPEQTVEQIITVSAKLFMEKGYEKTTMQDILNELKLSKGAIYHHFKSKEEIFSVVVKHWQQRETALVNELATRVYGANGKEKLQNLLLDYLVGTGKLYNSDAEGFLRMQPQGQLRMMTGEFIMADLTLWMRDIAPIFARLIEEGIADGSLKASCPLELAEISVLLLGLWIKPAVFNRSERQTRQRLAALKDILCKIGIDVLNDIMIEELIDIYRRLNAFTESEA